jgi:hypothetical protein
MPQFRQLAVDVSPGRAEFDPRPVLEEFVVKKSGTQIGFSASSLSSPVSIIPLMPYAHISFSYCQHTILNITKLTPLL